MTFGPFTLKDSHIEGGIFILELADSEGVVLHRPKRFVSYSGHESLFAKAKTLKGKQVTTETSNPSKNPPKDWWIDINEYYGSTERMVPAKQEPEYRFTSEQSACIESFKSASQLKISAFAGTGKTSTLLGIAKSAPDKKGLYLAFNKEIAEEAKKKFPTNVECRTTHSLAYEFSARNYLPEKLTGGMNAIRVAEFLRLEPVSFGENKNYSARQVGQWVVETVKTFCQSDASTLSKQHVTCPRLGQMDSPDHTESFSDYLLECASHIWDQARDPNSQISLGHDGYLKLWSISRPKLEHDFIMLDEAQDTTASVIHVLASQNAKTVYVGDKYQQIYGFRGAFNAMDKIHVERETALTTSFRFGSCIADVANAIIQRFGETNRIQGNPKVSSTVNKAQAKTYIYRTNMGVLGGLADNLRNNISPFIVGGITDLSALINDIDLMQQGRMAISNADFYGFKSWHDVVSFSKIAEGASFRSIVRMVATYGVPNIKKMIEKAAITPEESSVVLATAHKSKGKEWDYLEVCSDFATDRRLDDYSRSRYEFESSYVEEITLLYVALTRAKISLNLPGSVLQALDLDEDYRNSTSGLPEMKSPIQEQPETFAELVNSTMISNKPELPKKFKIQPNAKPPLLNSSRDDIRPNTDARGASFSTDSNIKTLLEKHKK